MCEEKETPFDRDTFIPAGNIAYGLAWTYVLNNLSFVLHGIVSIKSLLVQKNENVCIFSLHCILRIDFIKSIYDY